MSAETPKLISEEEWKKIIIANKNCVPTNMVLLAPDEDQPYEGVTSFGVDFNLHDYLSRTLAMPESILSYVKELIVIRAEIAQTFMKSKSMVKGKILPLSLVVENANYPYDSENFQPQKLAFHGYEISKTPSPERLNGVPFPFFTFEQKYGMTKEKADILRQSQTNDTSSLKKTQFAIWMVANIYFNELH